MTAASTVVTFARGAQLLREADRPSHFPIHRNGPPGTFVIIGTTRISLPSPFIFRNGRVIAGAI